MQKAHSASNNNYWKDYPLTDTPIIAATLNRIETNIDVIDDRVVAFDTSKANANDVAPCVSNLQYDSTTGTFTVTRLNGVTYPIDTDIEKIAINFDYDDDPTSAHYQSLVIELEDGTYKYIDMSALITQYEFTDTSTIHFAIGQGGEITAQVINGSITADKLQPNFLADCQAQVTAATSQAQTSEAWAKGTKGGTPVESGDAQYHNNAKYYSESSQTSSEDSEAWAKGTRNGSPVASSDPAYHNNSKYYSELAAPSISNCTDTAISSPTDGQILTYNGTSDKWENANAQGGGSTVTWTQIQSTGTKIAEIDIDGTSTDVYAPSGGSVLVDRTFNVASTDWEANTDPTTETDYPYIAEITSSVYSNTSKPIWQMNGVGTIPTLAEQEEIGYIIEAVFSSSGITLYAIDEPTVALVLEVKGE